MMSAWLEATAEFPLKSALEAKLSQFWRLLSEDLGCRHDQLVFDDINDVHCSDCGRDFTD